MMYMYCKRGLAVVQLVFNSTWQRVFIEFNYICSHFLVMLKVSDIAKLKSDHHLISPYSFNG